MSLNSLAYLLQAQGDLAGARPLYERALLDGLALVSRASANRFREIVGIA
jgi:hypothetical protein